MSRRFILLSALFFALMLLIVPAPALAQVENINFDDLLASLGPRDGRALIYDVLLYMIFFIAFINQFLIPDKQLPITVLNFIVMGLALALKLLVEVPTNVNDFTCNFRPPNSVFIPNDYAVFFMNVGIFLAPLLMAGGLRSVKGKSSKAVAPSIFLAILSGSYMAAFWFLEQRPCSDVPRYEESGIELFLIVGVFSLHLIGSRLRGWFRR